jgi:hypothetical protein
MINRQKTIKNLFVINTDFEWGASEAPGGRQVRRYVKTTLNTVNKPVIQSINYVIKRDRS